MASQDGNYTVELLEQAYGRCQAIIRDDHGNVVKDSVYKNRGSAQASVRQWLRKEGASDVSFRQAEPEEPPEPEPEVSLADRWLVDLRNEAQRALNEALALRRQADALEVAHKRLTVAADALEGPEG